MQRAGLLIEGATQYGKRTGEQPSQGCSHQSESAGAQGCRGHTPRGDPCQSRACVRPTRRGRQTAQDATGRGARAVHIARQAEGSGRGQGAEGCGARTGQVENRPWEKGRRNYASGRRSGARSSTRSSARSGSDSHSRPNTDPGPDPDSGPNQAVPAGSFDRDWQTGRDHHSHPSGHRPERGNLHLFSHCHRRSGRNQQPRHLEGDRAGHNQIAALP